MTAPSASKAKERLRFIVAQDRVVVRDRYAGPRDYALVFIDRLQEPLSLAQFFSEDATTVSSGKLIKFRRQTQFDIKEFNHD